MQEIIADNISVINSDDLEGTTRLDAEYYQPKYLDITNNIKSKKSFCIKDVDIQIVSGPFGSSLKSSAYEQSGIPFVRISNLDNFFVNKNEMVYISEEDNNRLSSSSLKTGDMVLSKVGNTIGVVSIITGDIGICNISENNIGLRFGKITDEFKYFLLAFLNSEYGKNQILRLISGNAQPKLNVSDIYNVISFEPESSDAYYFYSAISKAKDFFDNSQSLYSQAEDLLLEELGIKDIDLSHEPCYEVNSADAISANRIDAEYYQPKYERVIGAIKKHPYKSIGDMFRLIKGIEPGSSAYCEGGKPFIRVSNLNKFEINNDNQQYLSEKTYLELQPNYQPLKGEILLTKDATPGIAYHLKDQIDGIISSGILRLQALSNIKREYICLVIDSIVGQSQIVRDVGGSVINHWKPSQVKNTLIPLLPDKIQERIESLCLESHSARRQAKELLEKAKRKVEEMIGKGKS